jgi:hypothetical protein
MSGVRLGMFLHNRCLDFFAKTTLLSLRSSINSTYLLAISARAGYSATSAAAAVYWLLGYRLALLRDAYRSGYQQLALQEKTSPGRRISVSIHLGGYI